MSNVVLIGMPGSGKSTVGAALARATGMTFLDTDRVIEAEEGATLAQLIERHGDDGFRAIENRVNAELKAENAVIAPGGSVIYGREAMEHLRMIGTVAYLAVDFPELERRLGDLHARGVTIRPGMTLRDLYDERCPLYERWAHVTISCSGRSLADIVAEIRRRACGPLDT